MIVPLWKTLKRSTASDSDGINLDVGLTHSHEDAAAHRAAITRSEIEIRPIYEAEDFGEAMTPELQAREQRLREIEARLPERAA